MASQPQNDGEPDLATILRYLDPAERLRAELSEDQKRAFDDLGEGLKEETDRGLALVGAAVLDEALHCLLLRAFCDYKTAEDRLLGEKQKGGDRPLSSFGSKSALAYSLGLISKAALQQLDMIRKIRNTFAHSRDHLTFETSPIREWVDNLYSDVHPRVPMSEPPKEAPAPRDRFYSAVMASYANLHVLRGSLVPLNFWPAGNYEWTIWSQTDRREFSERLILVLTRMVPFRTWHWNKLINAAWLPSGFAIKSRDPLALEGPLGRMPMDVRDYLKAKWYENHPGGPIPSPGLMVTIKPSGGRTVPVAFSEDAQPSAVVNQT